MQQNRTENTKNINETETILRQQLKKEDYKEIKNAITSNETATRNSYSSRSLKSLLPWKISQNLQSERLLTIMKEVEQLKDNLDQARKPGYAQALKSNTNTFEKVNSMNHHKSKPNKNINGRLRSLSPANRKPKQGIIQSTNNSKTDLSSNYKY